MRRVRVHTETNGTCRTRRAADIGRRAGERCSAGEQDLRGAAAAGRRDVVERVVGHMMVRGERGRSTGAGCRGESRGCCH